MPQRRHHEPVPIDLAHPLVKTGHQGTELRVRHALGHGQVAGMQQPPIAQERLAGLLVELVPAGEPHLRQVEHPGEHVVDVVAARVRAAERVHLVRRDRGAAAGAGDPAREGGHSCPATSVRALNSLILSSQPASLPRSPVQNSWDRLALKSPTGTPCCSTQV